MEATEKETRTYTEAELTALLWQAQQGDPRALEELFSFLRARIFAIAKLKTWSIGLPFADAEDATQETLILVREHLSEFRAWENVMRFARTVLRNKLGNLHQLRAYRRPREVPLEEARVSYRMEAELEAAELQRILEQALEELERTKPRCGAIFRGICEGMSKKELCERLGISPGLFDVQLHRCRHALRRLLREKWGIEL